MIEKILDKYYVKKLKKFLDRELMIYFLDHRYIDKDMFLELQIKEEQYNDKQYKEILTFYKSEIFNNLCNQKELSQCLHEAVGRYLKENK